MFKKEFGKVSEEAYAYTPGLKVKRIMKIIKERRLPLPGKVLVNEEDKVNYDTIVAKTEVPSDPLLLKASEELGIAAEEIRDFLLKKEGDKIKKGEVICRFSWLFGLINRQINSPIEGEIESVSELTGQIVLRPPPEQVEINAYIPGRIVRVIPNEGVLIETNAVFIQGIFGLGGETHGILKIKVNSSEDVLTPDKISKEDRECILVVGSQITLDVYKKAVEVGVAGLVAGGMNFVDITNIIGAYIGVAITGEEEIGISLIITEGFGKMIMSPRTFQLLKSFEGRIAAINGSTQIRAGVMRPEIIIPHDENVEKHSDDILAKGMIPGTIIRIIREPFFGTFGTVVNLPAELQEIETGSFVRVLVVKLEDGQEVVIPRANVEIIEE